MKQSFNLKMLIYAYIDIYTYTDIEYFHNAVIILARNVRTVCNIKATPYSQISGLRSRFLVLSLQS